MKIEIKRQEIISKYKVNKNSNKHIYNVNKFMRT